MMMQAINPDWAMIAAWERRQEAFASYNALPDDNQPLIDGYGPGERELWAVIDAAEEEIRSATAATTRGAMIQLQCAVFHNLTHRKDVEAFERGDIAAVEASDQGPPDWSGRLVIAALRSLMAMEAAGC
jgi:hypothetical protein